MHTLLYFRRIKGALIAFAQSAYRMRRMGITEKRGGEIASQAHHQEISTHKKCNIVIAATSFKICTLILHITYNIVLRF